MAVTRIKNNQVTDSASGNATVGINAGTKIQDFSITATKIANNLTYGSDLTITGNLTVQGQSTAIDTTITTIEDPVIVLASTQSGEPTVDIGFVGERGTANNIAFVWDESASEFVTAFTSTGETNTTITITSYSNFHTFDANIGGNAVINGTTSLVGNLVGAVNATGNITGGNVFTAGVISGTGNITGGNILTGGLISATSTITSAANISGGNIVTGGQVSATGNITGGNISTEGTFTAASFSTTGNITGGNLLTGGLISSTGTITSAANISGGNLLTAGLVSSTGNVTGGNILTGGEVSATGNITSAANVSGGNIVTAGLISATGNISGGNIIAGNAVIGNINVSGDITVNSLTSNTFVSATGNLIGGNVTTAGLISATSTITSEANISGGNILTGGIVSATANVTGGNITTAGQVSATANVTGGNVLTGGEVSATGNITSAANVAGGNLKTTGGTFTGTLTTTGDALVAGNLVVQGNLTYINVDDLRVEDPIIILGTGPNGAPLTVNDGKDRGVFMEYFITAGNVLANAFMGYDNSTGNMILATTATIANDVVTVTTFGTLQAGNLNIESAISSGNITGGNILTAGLISGTGNITGGNVLTGGLISSTGTITSAANISGGNILTGGIVSATANVTGGNITTGGQVSATANVTGGNITTGGEVSATGNVTGGNVLTAGLISATSTITSAANISAGNILTGGLISATGDITGGNILSGGSGSFTGNVTAANFIGNISGNIDAAGANTEVQFNDTGDILGASAGFTFDKTANLLTVTGNISGGNILTGGIVSATANVTGGNLNTGAQVVATGNVTGGNLNTGAQVVATGNITGGNILTGGLISATGNTTTANLILTSGFIDGPAAGRVTINGSDIDTDFAVDGDTLANVFYVDAGTGTASFGASTQVIDAIVNFDATTSIKTPVGNTAQRPAVGVTGMLRFNTTTNSLEIFDNSEYTAVGVPVFTVIDDEQFNGDGSTVAFTLGSTQTTNSCIVSINGVVQIPTLAYSVAGTDPTCVLTFTEAPADGDVIDVRQITTTTTVTQISNSPGNAVIGTNATLGIVDITGDLVPTSNVAQDLGTTSLRWRDLYLAGNSIILGNTVIKNTSGNTIGFFGPDGTTAATIDAASVDTTTIANGTSSLAVIASGGNIRANIGGSTIINITASGIENGQANGVGNIGSTGTRFNQVFALASSAQYADLAEKYTADSDIAPGTVVCFGGTAEVTTCVIDSDRRVAGVVSTNPAYIMNDGLDSAHVVTVALTGRVPCRVTGTVRQGDLMVSAGNGTARAEADPKTGTVIGKALANSEGDAVIEVVVGRV